MWQCSPRSVRRSTKSTKSSTKLPSSVFHHLPPIHKLLNTWYICRFLSCGGDLCVNFIGGGEDRLTTSLSNKISTGKPRHINTHTPDNGRLQPPQTTRRPVQRKTLRQVSHVPPRPPPAEMRQMRWGGSKRATTRLNNITPEDSIHFIHYYSSTSFDRVCPADSTHTSHIMPHSDKALTPAPPLPAQAL